MLAFLGYGSEQIAKMLEADKISTPAHYHLKNGSKRIPTSVDPYCWASTTVAKILRSREYCGDVVNLKAYSNSYKDKKRRENAVENMIILRDVHEAIIDRSFWEYIQYKQNLHKTRKKSEKQSLFSGFLRCGDCGSNLHYHFNQANPSKEVEGHADIKLLTRDIIGKSTDWIAVYSADRSVRPYTQKIEISYHFIGKVEEIL